MLKLLKFSKKILFSSIKSTAKILNDNYISVFISTLSVPALLYLLDPSSSLFSIINSSIYGLSFPLFLLFFSQLIKNLTYKTYRHTKFSLNKRNSVLKNKKINNMNIKTISNDKNEIFNNKLKLIEISYKNDEKMMKKLKKELIKKDMEKIY